MLDISYPALGKLCRNRSQASFFGALTSVSALFYFYEGDFMKENELKRELELYKKMYYSLFNATTDAINICENDMVKHILIKAQQETEELYMQG